MLEIQIKYNNIIKWLIDGELIKVVSNLYISVILCIVIFFNYNYTNLVPILPPAHPLWGG